MDFSAAKEYIVNRLVKELSKDLCYHGAHHTFDVVKSAQIIGKKEGINNDEMLLLLTAAYYHDSGFLVQYANNEVEAVKIVKSNLPGLGYSEEQVTAIERIILATQFEVEPVTLLEEIMCDADHDYFGRRDYEKIAAELRKELMAYGVSYSDREWLEKQIHYLKHKHVYYTGYSKRERNDRKLKQIAKLEKELKSKW